MSTNACPVCGDTMTDTHDNLRPTWSDAHDDVICWWCANHTTPTVVTAPPVVFVMLDTATTCTNGLFTQSAPLTPSEARALAAELLRAADTADAMAAA